MSTSVLKAGLPALEAASEASSEAEVREIISDINMRIVAANRMPSRGPSIMLTPLNVDSVLRRWRDRRNSRN
jgi:hypothetical protein